MTIRNKTEVLGIRKSTYNAPTENMPARPNFFFFDICSLRMAVRGKNSNATSEISPKTSGSATCCTVVALHWPVSVKGGPEGDGYF